MHFKPLNNTVGYDFTSRYPDLHFGQVSPSPLGKDHITHYLSTLMVNKPGNSPAVCK